MVDGLRGQGTALVLTVGVAIDTGGKVLKVCLQLTLRIQRGACMVQVGDTCVHVARDLSYISPEVYFPPNNGVLHFNW